MASSVSAAFMPEAAEDQPDPRPRVLRGRSRGHRRGSAVRPSGGDARQRAMRRRLPAGRDRPGGWGGRAGTGPRAAASGSGGGSGALGVARGGGAAASTGAGAAAARPLGGRAAGCGLGRRDGGRGGGGRGHRRRRRVRRRRLGDRRRRQGPQPGQGGGAARRAAAAPPPSSRSTPASPGQARAAGPPPASRQGPRSAPSPVPDGAGRRISGPRRGGPGTAPTPGSAAGRSPAAAGSRFPAWSRRRRGRPRAAGGCTFSAMPAGSCSGGTAAPAGCCTPPSLRSARRRSASRSARDVRGGVLALRQHLDVGLDAGALDGAAGGRVVARRGQPDGAVAGDRHHGLHAALAEGLHAEDDRRGGGPAARRRRSREAEAEPPLISTTSGSPSAMSPGLGVPALRVLGAPGAGGDDLALVEEVVRDLHRLVEQPARVVAQVEHEALQVAAGLLAQRGDGAAQRRHRSAR